MASTPGFPDPSRKYRRDASDLSLSCLSRESPQWNGLIDAWVCADDQDKVLSASAVVDMVTEAAIALAAGSILEGDAISLGDHTGTVARLITTGKVVLLQR